MLIPTGTAGHRPLARSLCSRSATTSAPSLLKPRRLINASCSGKRKMRGLVFPGWGLAVTVPISMKPNPSAAQADRATPFLSRPAASPIGFGKSRPKTVFGFAGGRKTSSARNARSTCEAPCSKAIVRSWAASASSEKSSGLTNRS